MSKKLSKIFTFGDFNEAIVFVNAIAGLAEKYQHHPDIHIHYNQVTIETWTHTANGVTPKDHQLMTEIDRL